MIYYVDAKAGRNGDGTSDSPFKRIGDAAAVARPGDEVQITLMRSDGSEYHELELPIIFGER